MESVITQDDPLMTDEVFNSSTSNWKDADVLQLTHNFHKLDLNQGQYERVNYFSMKKGHVKKFNKIQEIKKFTMHLALDKENKEHFTFFPIFEIVDVDGKKYRFPLQPHQKPKQDIEKERTATNLGSQIVPAIFKDMIAKNWEEVEMSLVDDLFTVKSTGKPMERVLYYIVSPELINPYLPGNIKELKFYPGLDMNKFQYKDMVSFTPVIGIIPETPLETGIHQMKGILETNGNEVYVEYSRPCPPTCPD